MSDQAVILHTQDNPQLIGIRIGSNKEILGCNSFSINQKSEWTECCNSFLPDLSLAVMREYPQISNVSNYICDKYDKFIAGLTCTRCDIFENCSLANKVFMQNNQSLNDTDLLKNMKKFSLATSWN
jgi:hypothetical protein